MSPALALALGAALALTVGNPHPGPTARAASLLLKTSVVGLGFGMSLDVMLRAGGLGILYTIVAVLGTLAAGLGLGRLLRVPGETSLLIASGTSICGGSAIAAVGSAIGARAESMSVALATVFVLNAVALYVFPAVGVLVGLSEAQFGVWAAVAIHDTSSVVGAAAIYGTAALAVATVLKLARALWILPLTLASAHVRRRSRGGSGGTGDGPAGGSLRDSVPWFIVLFVLAVVARTLAPAQAVPAMTGLAVAARLGLVVTLFLIGASLSRATLRRAGGRPLAQGVVLWILVASVSLLAVRLWVPPV
jgi:uncharacterized integral membrane protein (TIGR00698 family)